MGQFRDMSIKKVVEELNQSFFLPDIQREYVWLNKEKDKKIEQLFDSILRGYPIGSFLFWKLKRNDIETNKDAKEDSEKLNFQLYKFIEKYDIRQTHNEKVNIGQVNSDDLSIVLDGQQRLTSLYIGLKGTRTLKKPKAWWDNPNAFEEKHLFLNLRYQPTEDNPDDNYQFEFKTKAPQANEKEFWFKVGDILHMDSILSFALEHQLTHLEHGTLEKLKEAFCTKSLISYFEETEKNLDKVLKIFIRVNSGGTQLSYSDLLMSILTANFSSDIRDLMNKLVDSFRDEGFGVMGRDQVLKTCLLLTESNHIFQLKNFNKSNINKIEEKWEKITETIFRSINLLRDFGYTNRLSSAYIVSVIAYYIFRNGNVSKEDKTEILGFVRRSQITAFFSTSLDAKLELAAKAVRASTNFKEVNVLLESNKTHPLQINETDVEQMVNIQYGSPAALPVLQVLYPHLDFKNSTFHIDHIYPKSRFKASNKALDPNYYDKGNFLFNLQLLQGEENQNKKAKDPEKWLHEYFENNEDKIKAEKLRNYIQEDFILDWERIEEFDRMRCANLLEELKKVFLKEKNSEAETVSI